MVTSDPDHHDQFPTEPIRRKRIPAGQAILVMFATFALVLVLDADGLTRTAERQQPGWTRTVALAVMHPVQDVSGALRLNRPRRWVADASGHDQDTRITSTKGVQIAQTAARATGRTTPTTIPPEHLRIPTASDPLRILVAGDSLSGHLGPSLSRALHGLPATVTLDEHVGTGLARPDVVDWPTELTYDMNEIKPDVVVLFLGGNDDQDLRTTQGWIPISHLGEWKAEYQRRIAQVMNIVTRPGVTLYWIGLPVMDKGHLQRYVPTMNRLSRTEAAARPGTVSWVDSDDALAGPKGKFATYLKDSDGRAVMVRESDGVHPTVAGMDRIVDLFSSDLIHRRHLRPSKASTTTPTTVR